MNSGKMLFVVIVSLLISRFLAQNCDKLGVLLYEDLACQPFYYGQTACPAKYTCAGVQKLPYCVFKGQMVKVDDEANATLAPPCFFGCFCTQDLTFSCPVVDCFRPNKTKADCYVEGDFSKCCPGNEICPTNSTVRCLVDGREYLEGQMFYPKNTCWECICHKGWHGVNEPPFCQRKRCGEQLRSQQKIQQACAPVYFYRATKNNTLCCPSQWICPTNCEEIKGEPIGGDFCRFGKYRLKIGQFIERYLDVMTTKTIHLRCNCVIPPLLSCTEVLRR